MTKFKLLDVVELLAEHPSLGLAAGSRATVVDVRTDAPDSVEIEVVRDDGSTSYLGPISPAVLRLVWRSDSA